MKNILFLSYRTILINQKNIIGVIIPSYYIYKDNLYNICNMNKFIPIKFCDSKSPIYFSEVTMSTNG
jgi:hypothetical protein